MEPVKSLFLAGFFFNRIKSLIASVDSELFGMISWSQMLKIKLL